MIIFAEFRRTTPFTLLEDAVKVTQVVETTAVANLGDSAVAVNQLTTGMAQTEVDDVFAEVTTRVQLKETAERRGAHACDVSQLSEANLVAVMSVDEGLHFMHTATITGHLYLGKARRGQRTGTLTSRQLIKDSEELGECIESVLDTTEAVEFTIDFHNGIKGETESLLGLDHHFLHRVKRVAVKDGTLTKVDVELDGNLANVVAGTGILLPDVLKVWASDEHEVEIVNHLVRVTHDTTHTGSMLYKIKFVDLMVMDGIGKFLLSPVGDIKDILAHQGRYLVND